MTGEIGDHEAGVKRKRATCDQDASVKKKPATFETGDREVKAVYDAYQKFKPTRVRNKKGEVRVRSGNRFYCLIVFY